MPLSDDIPNHELAFTSDRLASCGESRMRRYIVASALLICLIGWVLH